MRKFSNEIIVVEEALLFYFIWLGWEDSVCCVCNSEGIPKKLIRPYSILYQYINSDVTMHLYVCAQCSLQQTNSMACEWQMPFGEQAADPFLFGWHMERENMDIKIYIIFFFVCLFVGSENSLFYYFSHPPHMPLNREHRMLSNLAYFHSYGNSWSVVRILVHRKLLRITFAYSVW